MSEAGWDRGAVGAQAKRLRLSVDPRRRRLGAGSQPGSGPGASLEFHDHRAYQAGDDLRHLDWGVLARSDQLVIRRHRVEVAPRTEILLDASASMAAHPGKWALARNLAALLLSLAEAAGARPRLWIADQRWRQIPPRGWASALDACQAQGAAGLAATPGPGLAPGGERLLIGDGLQVEGGQAIASRLAIGAGSCAFLEILAAAECDPQPAGAVRLRDAEGGERELLLDAEACAAYRARLARHRAGWSAALSGRGPGVIACPAEGGLLAAVRALSQAGVVEVRA